MPIGATIGAAVVGAGAGIYSSSQASKAQTKAANQAADNSLAVANLNAGLFRETRDQNLAIASPFYNNGLLAGNALTDLLLGTHSFNPAIVANPTVPGGGTFPALTAGGGTGGAGGYSGPTLADINAMQHDGIPGNFQPALNAYLAANSGAATSALAPAAAAPAAAAAASAPVPVLSKGPGGWTVPGDTTATTPAPATGGTTPATGGVAPASALSAWDQFRNGTNYNWRLNEGLRALNSSRSVNGMFDSGAADRARIEYGQNYASNELGNYMNLLAGQQASGLSAAGAVMGVNTGYSGNVAAQNTNASNAASNAALVGGQANANMWGGISNSVGQLGGALFQYGAGGGFGGAATVSPAVASSASAIGNYGFTGGW